MHLRSKLTLEIHHIFGRLDEKTNQNYEKVSRRRLCQVFLKKTTVLFESQ